jgi:toxin ParE1/3/4
VRVALTAAAEQDLVEGAAFYAREADAGLARAFIAEFERSGTLLLEQPRLGAVWRGAVRKLPLRRFPFSLVYDLKEGTVRGLAIAHHRRRPGYWNDRRWSRSSAPPASAMFANISDHASAEASMEGYLS